MRTIAFLIAIVMSTLALPQLQTTGNLKYLVREPKTASENPPLLLLLHGVGSNEEDLFSFADQLPGEYLVVSARAPVTLGPSSFGWYQVDFSTGKPVFNTEQEKQSRATLISFIEELVRTRQVDPERVLLCGFSQGAIMSYSVALTRPDLVSGFAAMSGRLLEEVKPLVKSSPQLARLRVFISHGTQDNVLPVSGANEAKAYLTSLGITPEMKTYTAGHTINPTMLADLVFWLK